MADILGLLADAITGGVDWMRDPRRTQQMQGIGGLLADTLASASRHKGLMGQEAAYTQQAMKAGRLTDALRGGPAGARLDKAVADAYNPAGITVWHGSPHRFTKFDASKIGTGEGAQAYGHGIYVAESPEVAQSYQKALSSERGFRFGGKSNLTREQVQDLVNAKYPGGYLDGVIRPSGVADSLMDDMVTGLNRQQPPRQYKPGSERLALYENLRNEIAHADPGSLYKVDLPDPAVARMLDWDKPLSEQTESVREALTRIARGDEQVMKQFRELGSNAPANQAYAALTQNAVRAKKYEGMRAGLAEDKAMPSLAFGQDAASSLLRQQGIPGIRYLDRGSRGTGAGTSNFVVFPGEEDLLRILSVNGGLLTP